MAAVTPHQAFVDNAPDEDGKWSVECPGCEVNHVISFGWETQQDAQAFADRHRTRHQLIEDATG